MKKSCSFLLAVTFFISGIVWGQSLVPWMHNGKHGFANKEKKVVIEPVYELVMPFYEGYALVSTKTAAFFVDSTGKPMEKTFKPFDSYSDLPVMINGFYLLKNNPNGEPVAVHPQFGIIGNGACNFLKEISSDMVAIDENFNGYWLYHTSGKKVFGEKLSYAEPMGEKLIPVTLFNGTAGYIDKDGKVIIPFNYQRAKTFSEGLAPVKVNGKYGFIDKKGVMKIPPAFDDAEAFSCGVAVVKQFGAYGYIDKLGKMVLQPSFLEANSCINGYMCVKESEGLYAFYNKTGNRVNELKAYRIWGFSGNRALFFTGKTEYDFMGYVDYMGNVVAKPVYQQSSHFRYGIAKVRQKNASGYNYTGYIDTTGNAVIPFGLTGGKDFLQTRFALVTRNFGDKFYDFYVDTANVWYTSLKPEVVKTTTTTPKKPGVPQTHCVTFILEKEQTGLGSRRMVTFFMFVQVNDKSGSASEARLIQEARKVFHGRNMQGYRERGVVVDKMDCMESKRQADNNPNIRIDQFIIEHITIN